MWDYLVSGGYAMWGVLFCGIVMVATCVRAALRPLGRSQLDAILLWAGAALGLGVIGTLVGISFVARAMSAVRNPPPGIAWSGINMALSTTVVGTLFFLFGLAGWGMLRMRAPHDGRTSA